MHTKPKTPQDTPKPYARFRIEGLDAAINAVIWPDDFKRFEPLLNDGAAVMAGGRIARDFREQLEIQISELVPLESAHKLFAEKVCLHLPEAALNAGRMERIRQIVAEHPGTVPLSLCVLLDSGEKVFIKPDSRFQVSAVRGLVRALEQVVGEEGVYVAARPQPLLREPAPRRFNGRR